MAKRNSIPSQEILQNLFTYKDGFLYWKEARARCVKKGSIAGCLKSNNYWQIYINNKAYSAHRLIFMFFHGFVPDQVDHIDNCQSNNKIENLRPASQSQNCLNRKISKQNKTGYKNVSIHSQTKKFHVTITLQNKIISFGLYDDLELAGLVAAEARDKYCKEFARHF
jgi:hypothetical protein